MGSGTKRLIVAAMLVVITGLPVTSTMCEALCERSVASATAGAPTSESMTGCHESPAASKRLAGASTHCRTHDDEQRAAEATRASIRAHAVALSATSAPAPAPVSLASPLLRALAGHGPPRATLSPAPLVLRI